MLWQCVSASCSYWVAGRGGGRGRVGMADGALLSGEGWCCGALRRHSAAGPALPSVPPWEAAISLSPSLSFSLSLSLPRFLSLSLFLSLAFSLSLSLSLRELWERQTSRSHQTHPYECYWRSFVRVHKACMTRWSPHSRCPLDQSWVC